MGLLVQEGHVVMVGLEESAHVVMVGLEEIGRVVTVGLEEIVKDLTIPEGGLQRIMLVAHSIGHHIEAKG